MDNKEFTIKGKLVSKNGSGSFDLVFNTVPELFSYKHVDEGTMLLLGELEVKETDDCLDMGCGYGVIGISMAKLAPKGRTYLVDRDFIAVDYANINIRENGLHNAEARLSNGFSHLKGLKFDVIASNLPTHIGQLSLRNIISDMKAHLKPSGRVYVVTVSILKPFIKREFLSVFGNYEKLKQGRKHLVSMAVKE
ncbi:MAG: methyltransferase [Candidatus Micrarchaeaceae archaeon]|jgi:16S rRNA G1207 methylase RsmC|nr:methyltransferase [Candidatus Micrarchaeota archaeon]HII09714.1 methyltransferase [Candidatus Micrarchaeota archaeon]